MKTNIRKNKTGIIGIATVIACAIVFVSAPAFATIVLEIHSDTTDGNTTFTDSTLETTPHIITAIGGAKHSEDTSKFGTSSMFFDGDGDYLTVQDHDDWNFGDGDFTIDGWVKFDSLPTISEEFYTFVSHGTNSTNLLSIMVCSTGQVAYQVKVGNVNQAFMYSTNTMSAGSWNHFAAVKSGSTYEIFINGVEDLSVTYETAYPNFTGDLSVGYRLARSQYYLNGYLDDIYIRKGEALNQYQISAISSVGNELREEMIDAFNGGGVDQFGFGYTDQEISQLAEVYAGGTESVTIGDLTWSYLDGDLPGDTGFAIGESYMYGGKWYVKLGSGLEGVPEVPKGPSLFMAMVFVLCAGIRKRLVPRVYGTINKTCYKIRREQ